MKSLIFKEKKSYFSKTINENKGNPKDLWKNLKDISGQSSSHQINLINDEMGNPFLDPLSTAEAFNKYFAELPLTYTTQSSTLNENTSLKDYLLTKLKPSDFFIIPKVTSDYVLHELQSLSTSKATGLDDMSAKFLKISAECICYPITKIFNLSISTGIYPKQFKIAKVIPVYKKGCKLDKNNYRPISILPVISKILERHTSKHLKQYLEINNLLYERQSGF